MRDQSTTRPRPSIGTGAYACWKIVSVTTCAADANTSSSADGGQAVELGDDVRAVVLVHERVGVLGRRVVDDRGERLVVDVDELGRVLGEVPALGDHERDRVADEAHLALGERRARRLRAPRADRRVPLLLHLRVEVGGGEHEVHARRAQRRGRVDPADRRCANGLRTKHACSIPGSETSST